MPCSKRQKALPPVQLSMPNFQGSFKAQHDFFYFLHKIDAVRATLTVEVIGPNLTFTFTHARALGGGRFSPSEIVSALERKTVGFISLVKNSENRQILAWAESGHGLGRSGDLVDAPKDGPVLSSELWTRRVIHIGKLLGMNMRRSFDNANNSLNGSLVIDGIFQGSHVEAKLAVHAIWVMLEVFEITKDLNDVTKEDLMKLRNVLWEDGTKPAFEVYFSRKNCSPCGVLVQGLSELTGIEIKLFWKERLKMKEYYKPPKNKTQALAQKKACRSQQDILDFDDLVANRAEEDGGRSSDQSIFISDVDTPDSTDGENDGALVVVGDGTAQGRIAHPRKAIDLTEEEEKRPSGTAPAKSISRLMQERHEFMEEMHSLRIKADTSAAAEVARQESRQVDLLERPIDLGHQAGTETFEQNTRMKGRRKPADVEQSEIKECQLRSQAFPMAQSRLSPKPTRKIRKPIPATSVEEELPHIEEVLGKDGGSQHRRRFLSKEKANGAASPGEKPSEIRQRLAVERNAPSCRETSHKPQLVTPKSAQQALQPRPPAPTTHYPEALPPQSHPHTSTMIDLCGSDEVIPEAASEIQTSTTAQSNQVSDIVEVDKVPRKDDTVELSTPDLSKNHTQPTARVLFPGRPNPRFDFSQSAFPSPKPAENDAPSGAPAPTHHDTPGLRRSVAENEQKTIVLHYPDPGASSIQDAANQPNSAGKPWPNLSGHLSRWNEDQENASRKRKATPRSSHGPWTKLPVWNGPSEPSLARALREEKDRIKRPRLSSRGPDGRSDSRKKHNLEANNIGVKKKLPRVTSTETRSGADMDLNLPARESRAGRESNYIDITQYPESPGAGRGRYRYQGKELTATRTLLRPEK